MDVALKQHINSGDNVIENFNSGHEGLEYINSIHEGPESHKCYFCDKDFSQAERLKKHINLFHYGLKKHIGYL